MAAVGRGAQSAGGAIWDAGAAAGENAWQTISNPGAAVSRAWNFITPDISMPAAGSTGFFADFARGYNATNKKQSGARTVNWATDEARPWIPAQKPVAPAADPWAPFVDFYRDQGFATAHGY